MKKIDILTDEFQKKIKVSNPIVEELQRKRSCITYGRFIRSRTTRYVSFDLKKRECNYSKEMHSKSEKSYSLKDCKCKLETISNHDGYLWLDAPDRYEYRLCMRFVERKSQPILIYGNDFENLLLIKCLNQFCKLFPEENNKLQSLLSVFSYMYSRFALMRINKLHERIYRSSIGLKVFIIQTYRCASNLKTQEHILVKAWASAITSREKHFRPISTIRLNNALKLFRSKEKLCEEAAAKKIVEIYHDWHKKGFSRSKIGDYIANDFIATAAFDIDQNILPFVEKKQEVEQKYMSFAKFDFPSSRFRIDQCKVRLDFNEFKIMIEESRSLQVKDISSLVLNDKPKNETKDNKSWLRINGRKIVHERLSLEAEHPEKVKPSKGYIDPSEHFLSMSIDSYLTTKVIAELNFYTLQIKDTTKIENRLGTNPIKLGLKVSSGVLWTNPTFVTPKVTKDSLTCYFGQSLRTHVDDSLDSCISIILCGKSAAEPQKKKHEVDLASIKIPIKKIEVKYLMKV